MQEPHNLDAEQGLLGMLLLDNRQYDLVASTLKSEHFYRPEHGRIYQAICEAVEQGATASSSTMKDLFDGDEAFKAVDGHKYLERLQETVPLLNNTRDYANTIRNSWLKRQALYTLNDLKDVLSDAPAWEDPREIMRRLETVVHSFEAPGSDDGQDIQAALDEATEWTRKARNGEQVIYKTGLAALDHIIGGLRPGGLYVVAGRPGMGKTVLAVNVAEHISKHRPVKFFSLEMTKSELAMRLYAGRTSISVKAQMMGTITEAEEAKLLQAKKTLQGNTLYVDDRSGVEIEYICASARRFARARKNGVIIIDHLGLIRGEDRVNRTHQIEKITNRLKSLAKEINAPVLLLSQLSRAVEGRDDKRPQLSDLRDSGSIEQDADVVMFAYRPEYYLEREPPVKFAKESDAVFSNRIRNHNDLLEKAQGKAFIHIEKNRQGTVGTARLGFNGLQQRFYDDE